MRDHHQVPVIPGTSLTVTALVVVGNPSSATANMKVSIFSIGNCPYGIRLDLLRRKAQGKLEPQLCLRWSLEYS